MHQRLHLLKRNHSQVGLSLTIVLILGNISGVKFTKRLNCFRKLLNSKPNTTTLYLADSHILCINELTRMDISSFSSRSSKHSILLCRQKNLVLFQLITFSLNTCKKIMRTLIVLLQRCKVYSSSFSVIVLMSRSPLFVILLRIQCDTMLKRI